jgi:hypothetical protein
MCQISPKSGNNVESSDINLLTIIRKMYLPLRRVSETLSHSINIYWLLLCRIMLKSEGKHKILKEMAGTMLHVLWLSPYQLTERLQLGYSASFCKDLLCILLLSHSFIFLCSIFYQYTVVFLFNTVIYVFLLLGLCILIVRLPWLIFFCAFSSVVRQMPK